MDRIWWPTPTDMTLVPTPGTHWMWAEGQVGPSQPVSLGISGENCQLFPEPLASLCPASPFPTPQPHEKPGLDREWGAEPRREDTRLTVAEGKLNTAPAPGRPSRGCSDTSWIHHLGLSTTLTHLMLETPAAGTSWCKIKHMQWHHAGQWF